MLASETLDEPSKKKAIEVIQRNVKSQAQLIEDLLNISRIISGKLRLDVKPIDPAAVVNAAIDVMRPAADAKSIQIETVVDSEATPMSGDFQRLQQVVWNLLSNAVKFTPAGSSVKIAVTRVRSHLEISVTDTGARIRSDFLPYVFNRFSQANSSITRAHGGLGIGLTITKSIVKLHSGSISASSGGEGKGSTFVIKLPIAPIRSLPDNQNWTDESFALRQELVDLKILVVDDEQDTCDMLRFLFERAGAIVQAATSAEDAIEVIDTWDPDVLVSDIGMPNVDSFELIKRIRARKQSNMRPPAVALTALTRIEDRVKALSAGYHMHVAKPIEPAELLSIVASLAGLAKR